MADILRLQLTAASLVRQIGGYATVYTEGSEKRLSQLVGVPHATIAYWRRGMLPGLRTLAEIAVRLRLSLADLLLTIPSEPAETPTPRHGDHRKPRPMARRTLAKDLELAMESSEGNALSLAEIARRLSVHPQTIRRQFPTEARRIVTQHRSLRAERWARSNADLVAAVRAAVESLYHQGISPTRRQVAEALDSPARMRNPRVRAAYFMAMAEFGLIDRADAEEKYGHLLQVIEQEDRHPTERRRLRTDRVVVRRRLGKGAKYTAEECLAALRRYVEEHGKVPSGKRWEADRRQPSGRQFRIHFRTFRNAILAAGLMPIR